MRGSWHTRMEKRTPNKHMSKQDALSIVWIFRLCLFDYQQQLRKLTLSDTFSNYIEETFELFTL